MSLAYFMSPVSFYTLWKYQILWFSDVFRGYGDLWHEVDWCRFWAHARFCGALTFLRFWVFSDIRLQGSSWQLYKQGLNRRIRHMRCTIASTRLDARRKRQIRDINTRRKARLNTGIISKNILWFGHSSSIIFDEFIHKNYELK